MAFAAVTVDLDSWRMEDRGRQDSPGNLAATISRFFSAQNDRPKIEPKSHAFRLVGLNYAAI